MIILYLLVYTGKFSEMGKELKSLWIFLLNQGIIIAPPHPPVAMSLGPHVEFKNSPCQCHMPLDPHVVLCTVFKDNRDRLSFWSYALKIPLPVACSLFRYLTSK